MTTAVQKLKAAWKFILDRMSESSTARGLVGALVLIGGFAVAPERLDAIAVVAAFVSAMLKVILPDRIGGSDSQPKE